jgi:carboxymethylenebutenolidase
MCHSEGDRLPTLPGREDTAAGQELHLVSADGTRFLAYHVAAASPSALGLVVIPSANGLVPFFKELCHRLAAEGYHTIGIDYYGRTAGLTERVDEVKIYPENMPKVRPETADLDIAAAAEYLQSPEGGAVARVASIGFCFGGAMSWRQAARGFAGAVGFYGCAQDLRESVSDLHELRSPLLLLVAGEDQVYPPDDLIRLGDELTAIGVPHTMTVAEDAPHGFFKLGGRWQGECERAWENTLSFLAACAAPVVKG